MKSAMNKLTKLILIVIILGLMMFSGEQVYADLTGWQSASSVSVNSTDISSCSGRSVSYNWSNTGNIYTSNNARATLSLASTSLASYAMIASGFGFSIPAGSTINGIEVNVEGYNSSGTGNIIASIKVPSSSSINCSYPRYGTPTWSGSEVVHTFGSSTELWGCCGSWISANDVNNNTNFGVGLWGYNTVVTWQVDHVQMRVHYTPPANTPTPTPTNTPTPTPTPIPGAGNFIYMDSGSALGGGATDCQDDPNGTPCAPVNSSGTNGTNPNAAAASTTQINLSWGINTNGGAVPARTSYDVYRCGLNQSSCGSPSIVNVSNTTTTYNNSGIACSASPYYYRIVAKNTTNGNTQSNIFSGTTSACASIPTVTTPTFGSVTSSGAVLGANVTSNGGAALSARGTCWGTSPNPTTNCSPASGTTTGTFTHSRTGMPFNTLIYFRGYATNIAGTGYSSPDGTFTTLKKANGQACASASECQGGFCYADGDGDRYVPSGGGTAVCRSSSQLAGTDCYDGNSNAYPGSSYYGTSPRGDVSYDYNCDTQQTKYWDRNCVTTMGSKPVCQSSQGPSGGSQPGFVSSVPACGASGTYRRCWKTDLCVSYGGINLDLCTDPDIELGCVGSGLNRDAYTEDYSVTMSCN